MASNLLAGFIESGRDKICTTLVWLMDRRSRVGVQKLTAEQKTIVRSIVRPGDILLDANDAYPGWQLASRMLFGCKWVHMGFCVGENAIVDAGKETSVAEISLNRFLNTSRVVVLRPRYQSDADLGAAIDYARSLIGRKYNRRLDLAAASDVYCTQLARQALAVMENPISVSTVNILGREIVSPGAFLNHPQIDLVWSSEAVDSDQNSFGGETCFVGGLSGNEVNVCTN